MHRIFNLLILNTVEVMLLRKELAQQAIGVLISAALPRHIRPSEIEISLQGLADFAVLRNSAIV